MSGDYLLAKELAELFAPMVARQVTNLIRDVLKQWKNKDNPPLGACYFNPKPSDDFWHLLDRGIRNANNVKMLTTTGYTTYGATGLNRLESALRIKTKGELRFLLLDPNAIGVINRRLKELPYGHRYTIDAYQKEIITSTGILKVLSQDDRYNPKIKLRYFQHYPIWRVFIFDDVIAFVQPYLSGVIGDLSPVIGFKKVSDENQFSLFDFYLEYFDKTFEFGKVMI